MSTVLVVDDDKEMAAMLSEALVRRGYAAHSAHGAKGALERLQTSSVDVVLTDLRMQGLDGIQLCEQILSLHPGVSVIVMTAFGSMDAAVAAMRAGAADFLAKPFKPDTLALTLERVLAHRELVQQVSTLEARLAKAEPFQEILGESAAIRDLCQVLDRVARSEVSVLLTGETGTGKELAARSLHAHGPRADHPFVAINCAAIPENLLESELFGHARGAFTGAGDRRAGLFQEAKGGTLFLDEIGDMPASLQVKLLRALQERKIRPVGSDREVEVDVRVVSATHCDLQEQISQGLFREDLYYRLNVVQVRVPPLRERGSDVLLLAQHFLDRACRIEGKRVRGFSPEATNRLAGHDWPGNIRELSNCVERAVALTEHEQIQLRDLPGTLRSNSAPSMGSRSDHEPRDDEVDLISLRELERRHILRVLRAVEGNKARAARILGLDRKTLYRRLEGYEEPTPTPPNPNT